MLNVRLLRHLLHQRAHLKIHMVLRRRHGLCQPHRVLHVPSLYIEVRELRLELVRNERDLGGVGVS